MKKLKLNIESLAVQSFTAGESGGAGTVRAASEGPGGSLLVEGGGCYSFNGCAANTYGCPPRTAYISCRGTCDQVYPHGEPYCL